MSQKGLIIPLCKTLPRWRRRKGDRRQELLDAALTLFLSHGYSDTRMDDVALLAGVGKGTLYNYFENKETLFFSAIEHNTQCQVDGALAIIDSHRGSSESLIRILMTVWWDSVFSKTTGSLLKIVISESGTFPSIAKFYLDSVIKPLEEVLSGIVNRGSVSGEFLPTSNATAIAQIPLNNLMMLALWRLTFVDESRTENLAETVETVLDTVLRGIRRIDIP